MIRISKEFNWEMGHRLMNYNGNCSNPHGHSYKIRVTLYGFMGENGMLLDYKELNKIVKPLLNKFDHSFAINENDSAMKEFFTNNNFKCVMLPFDPTAENLALFIGRLLEYKFKRIPNVREMLITIFETSDVYAEKRFRIVRKWETNDTKEIASDDIEFDADETQISNFLMKKNRSLIEKFRSLIKIK